MTGAPPVSVAQVLDALPQTQCTRCGYPDCASYARAIVEQQAPINQCPPGGAQGIARLAALTGKTALPLNPEFGAEQARTVVWIDEQWCIGCTLCIKACPVDAIVGTHKHMHTVLEADCTGCELCIPVCPVDCIELEIVTGDATGWDAWTSEQAQQARERYDRHQARVQREAVSRQSQHLAALQAKAADLPAHSRITDPAVLERKRSVIEQALAKARARQAPQK